MRRVVLLAAAVGLAICQATEVKTITACQLLRDAQSLDGRVVAVRGLLSSRDKTDPYFDQLLAEDCAGENEPTVVIRLVPPDVHFLKSPPDGFHSDLGSLMEAEEQVTKLLNEHQSVEHITATIEGAVVFPGAPSERKTKVRKRPYHKQYRVYLVVGAIRDITATSMRGEK